MTQPDPPPGFEPVGGMGPQPAPPPGFEPVQSAGQPAPPPGFEPVQSAGQPAPPPGFEPAGVVAPTPESRNMFQSGLLDPLGRGFNQLTSSGAALGARLGVISADTAAGQIAQDQTDMLQYPVQPNVQAGMQRIQDAGAARGGVPGVFDALGQAVQEPRVLGDVVVQSLPASSPAIAGGAAGALVGSGLGPPGILGGAIIGSFLGGAPTEFGNTIVEKLQEARIPLTRDNIARALQDPAFIDEATRSGLVRGATIGALDAASLGVAGRVFGPVARTVGGAAGRVPGAIAGGAAEVGVQGAAGAIGEGLAQTFDEGRITKPAEVALEGAAGAATTIPDILTMRAAQQAPAPAPTPVPVQPTPPPGFEPVQTPEPPPVEAPPVQTAPPVQPVPAPEPPPPPSPEPAPEPATPPIAPQPAPSPGTGQRMSRFSTPDNVDTFEAPFEVVDLSTLRGATDDLQPRDRETRAASDQQILDIANRLNPAQLIDDPVSDRGSPIVDENSTILSGNGRVSALELAARNNPERYEAYKQALREQGFNVDGAQTPVLVRRLAGLAPEAKRAFVIRSNEDTKLSYSPGELAKIDGSRISEDMLRGFNTDSDTGVLSPANRNFVREFMGRLNKNQQNALMTAGGQLNPQGQRRLENALFARAYDNPDLVTRVVENEEGGGLRNALLSSAPAWAQMRAVGDKRFDVTPQLTRAVDAYADMRARGVKLNDYLAQQDAFDPLPPEAETLLRLMHNQTGNRVAAWRDVRDVLKEYSRIVADEARAVGRIDGKETNPGEILKGILARRDKGEDVGGGQGGMFSRETPDNRPDRPEPRLDSERIPRGGLTPVLRKAANYDRAPRSAELFREVGIDPERGVNLPPQQQIAVLAKALMSKFGFRDVSDRAPGGGRKAHGLDAIDNMLNMGRNGQAMAHVLGLPLTAISLNGTLSLSYTQLGKERYFGAYSPWSRHIDLTNRSNAFAHEWMHGLDHYVMEDFLSKSDAHIDAVLKAVNPLKGEFPLLSEAAAKAGLKNPSDRVQLAFVSVMKALYLDNHKLALEALRLQFEAAKVDATGAPTPQARVATAALEALNEGRFDPAGLESKFFKKVLNFSGASLKDYKEQYLPRPAEMLARAFEAYVAFKATQAGLGQDVDGIAKKDALYTDGADLQLQNAYPKAEDRVRIFNALDDLMAEVANAAIFQPGAAPRPLDSDITDPNAYAKAVAAMPRDPLWQQVSREMGVLANGVKRAMTGDLPGVLSDLKTETKARMGVPSDPNAPPVEMRRSLMNGASLAFMTIRGVGNNTERALDSPEAKTFFKSFVNKLYDNPGRGEYTGQSFGSFIANERRKATNRVVNLLKANGLRIGRLSAAENELLRLEMLGRAPKTISTELARVAAGLRSIMNEKLRQMRAAGIDVGYVTDTGYLSRNPNTAKVQADPDGFVRKATQVDEIVFDRDYKRAGSLADKLDVLNEKTRQVLGVDTANDDFANDPNAPQAHKDMRKAVREYKKAGKDHAENPTPQTDAALQKATKELSAAMDAYADSLKPIWSNMMATRWLENILAGDMAAATNADASFTKERKLPPEADIILSDFYDPDPVSVVLGYVERADRKIAVLERYGNVSLSSGKAVDLDLWLGDKTIQRAMAARGRYYNKTTPEGRLRIINELIPKTEANIGEMELRELQRAGATVDQLDTARGLMRTVTGLQKGPGWRDGSRVLGALYAAGTIALLGRVIWTSLAEPMTMILRTGNVGAGLKTMGAYLREAVRSAKSVQDLQTLAEHVGIVTDPYFEGLINHQLSSMANDPVSMQMMTSAFMQRIGLTSLTNAQKRAAIAGSWHWFTKLADSIKNPKDGWATSAKARAESARAEFRELGIPDNLMNDWVDWVLQNDGKLPGIDQLDGTVGRLFEVAITSLNKQVIQEPNIADKPVFAAHPWGRMVYAIMSFSYSFTRSIHLRTVLKAMRDADLYRQDGMSPIRAGAVSGGQAAAVMAGGFMGLILTQLLVTAAREAIFNGEAWEEREKEGELESWLVWLAISRSGLFGASDPIIQAYTGLRYERDLTALAAGAHLSFFLNTGLQTFGGLLTERNSPNTNTSEYKAVKAAYQTIVSPAIAAGLAIMPGGPVVGTLAGAAIQGLTSNAMADNVAEALVGEKGSPTGDAARRSGSRF